jgi:site-specific DNA-methyltransferase (adenine-specific)
MAVFFTKETDGLKNLDKWEGNVFINPPYGPDIKHWLAAAKQYAEAGRGIVVLLLPARTDTRWFHEYVYQKPNVEVRFLKGRLRFVTPEGKQEGSAPFPSMLAIFTPPESCRSNPADFQKIDAWDLDKLVL